MEKPRERREEEMRRRRRKRRSLFRIVHAREAIPNEVGPTRCRATPALGGEELLSSSPMLRMFLILKR